MEFKYVPVLKNRQSEREALENQTIGDKIIPLVEMVIEKPNVNSKGTFATVQEPFLKKIGRPVIVDIPMYLNLTPKTINSVSQFLAPIYASQLLRINYLNQLATLKNIKIIPTVSYMPNVPYLPGFITQQANVLRQNFPNIAYRVYSDVTPIAISEIRSTFSDNDIIILDIDENPHTQSSLVNTYRDINNLKSLKSCKTVLVRSAIPQSLKNTSILDGHVIGVADNSLMNYHTTYGFDSFGDCAGIRRAEIENIPASSPAYINYYQPNNVFVGYKGIYNTLRTFTSHVLPNYTASIHWTTLTGNHKDSCYGCKLINSMLYSGQSANSAPKWKAITIAHYIKSIDELL